MVLIIEPPSLVLLHSRRAHNPKEADPTKAMEKNKAVSIADDRRGNERLATMFFTLPD